MNFIISFVDDLAETCKRLIPYAFYNFIFFISYLLIISIFAFFHFMLGHKFNLIEIWVQENIWIILIFSKLMSFFLIYQYYKVQNLGDSLIQQYFIKPFHYPLQSFYVVLFFLLIFSIVELRPQFNERWSFLIMMVHLVGHIIYFATDFLVVSYLIKRKKLNSRGDAVLTILLSSLGFGMLSYIIISSKDNFSFYFIFEFFLMIFFYHKYKSWIASAWVLLLFIVVLNILLGQDIFYEDDIGLFRCEQNLSAQQIVIAFTIGLLYLKWRPLFWKTR